MATNMANIRRNAVEILFVEELTKWLLHRRAGIPYKTAIAGPYSDSILNVFNDEVREAVNFIDMSLEGEIQENFSEFIQVNENSFIDYARHYEEICFEKGFLADNFLEFCVRLVSMAVYFVVFDVTEALNITRRIILKLFEDRGMFAGGWDSLIVVAKKYAKVYKDLHNAITPEDSDDESSAHSSGNESSEESSRNELSADNSVDNLDINEGYQACDYVSNRDQQQKPEGEFKSEDLSEAKGGLQPERSSKAITNGDFDSRWTLEGTSTTYELFSNAQGKYVSSTSNGESNRTTLNLIATNVKIPTETVQEH